MKKLTTLIVAIATFSVANATNYFVDLSKSSSGDGTTWATAFKNVQTAETAADLNPGVDNIFIKGDGYAITYNWSLKAENYYFSCAGTEATPAERPMNDNDGNGIIEPWEFKYPTVFVTTNVGNGPTLIASSLLDGLTIKHIATRTNTAFTSLIIGAGSTAQNIVISGSVLTYSAFTNDNGGCLVKVSGTLRNSLFEKNTISVTATVDKKFTPVIEAVAVSTNDVIVSGCIIRNNKATLDFSSGTSTAAYLRGMALNFSTTNSTPATNAIFSDCIVHNNEFTYIGNSTTPIADRASVAGSVSFSNNTTNGKYINCTFANNKLTNMKSAMNVYFNGVIYHYVYNNVFWNNQNTITSTAITSNVGLSSSAAQAASSVVSNNVQDCPTLGNWGTVMTFTNNLLDLAQTATGTNAPNFRNPTTLIGVNRIAGSADSIAIAQADWRLNQGSYLAAKGTPTFILTDKAGNAFTATPAAGAYEYMFPAAVENIRNDIQVGKVIKNTFISGIDAKVDIYSTLGKLTRSVIANKGQEISLPAGVYLVKAKTAQGIFVQKICL
jgi:hypothetical protein